MGPAESFPLAGRRIWVTGGTGFLGRHLTQELSRRGSEPLVTRSSEVDLLDPGAAERFLSSERPDGVIHLAGRVGGIGANRHLPATFFYANMAMGLHLIEACRRQGVGKLLVAGTVCSYPKHCPIPFHEDDLWNGYPEETNAPYGVAKRALLVQLQAYRQEFGLDGIFIIPVNLYGPGDHLDPQTSHVIPAMIRKFIEARRRGAPCVELWGTGRVSREFLYVEDAAAGLCQAMERHGSGEPVNLGTGREVTILELAHMLRRLAGYSGDIRFDPGQPDGQPRRCLDTRKAEASFGWTASVPLEEGLRRTVAWIEAALPGT